MSNLFDYGESLEKKTESVLQNCEDSINLAFKATGNSFMDAMCGLNAETGAMMGSCMNLYKDTKQLMIMLAKAMDKMLDNFDELKEMNEVLRKQNDMMQDTLQDLSRKIDNK